MKTTTYQDVDTLFIELENDPLVLEPSASVSMVRKKKTNLYSRQSYSSSSDDFITKFQQCWIEQTQPSKHKNQFKDIKMH